MNGESTTTATGRVFVTPRVKISYKHTIYIHILVSISVAILHTFHQILHVLYILHILHILRIYECCEL